MSCRREPLARGICGAAGWGLLLVIGVACYCCVLAIGTAELGTLLAFSAASCV